MLHSSPPPPQTTILRLSPPPVTTIIATMQPHMAAVLSVLLLALLLPATMAFNITKILKKHPEFSSFNEYLTKTHLANEINHRDTITVLALDNSAMSSLISKGFTLYTLRNVLSLHVLVDYYGTKKLHQITDGTTTTATLFQSSGDADGDAGYVNITDMHGGKVGFGPANTGDLNSFFVKSVVEEPYNVAVIHISQVLDSAEAEAPTAEPSKVNLTSLLSDKGCKEFSRLLTSSGAAKIFQENIESGLTVFCASDNAVKAFMPKYKNLTAGNKTALLLFHGIPIFTSISILKSSNGIMNTLATEGANKYDFTIQNDDESVTIKTKVVTAKITGTLVDKDPLAVFKLDKVLLPRELFKPSAKAELAPSADAEAPGPDSADGSASDDDEVADQTAHRRNKNAAGKINGGGFVAMGLTLCYSVLAAL